MKLILLSLTFALFSFLAGCGTIGQMFQPPDPVVVRAEATADNASRSVDSFLRLQKATPDSSNLDAHIARSLAERFPQDLATLKGLLEAYRQTRSPYAKSALLPAIDAVKSAGDVAHSQLSTQPPIQSRYDSGYAPPITPQVDMNSLWVNIAEMRAMLSSNASQVEGLNLKVSEMDAKVARLTVMQRRALATNATILAPPLTNVIPSRVP